VEGEREDLMKEQVILDCFVFCSLYTALCSSETAFASCLNFRQLSGIFDFVIGHLEAFLESPDS
jgi:hypothetical protein